MWTVVLVYALSPSLLLFPSISLRFLIIVYFTLLLVKILLLDLYTRDPYLLFSDSLVVSRLVVIVHVRKV